MNQYYFSVNLENDRTLFLAPLTERLRAHIGDEIDDVSGHFLYEKHGTDANIKVEIIARVMSEDAIFRLKDIFNMS